MPSGAGHQCIKCGFQNEEPAVYCVSCGENLHAHCPNCHAPVRSDQSYCGKCGRLLGATLGSSSRIQTPQHLAERIRSAQEGERKIATVLFADIASSTALIGDRDAEDARQILKPTVDIMGNIVHHYEGITREQGDGIMASFGAPVALEDHAVRACYAALDMQEALRTLAAEVRREFGMLFEVRIGINSGPVVVTVNHQEEDFSRLSRGRHRTHIAKRVESLALPGTILLTRDTLALAKGFVRVSALGPVPLRGIAGQVEVCELEGVNTRMRMHALAKRGLSKFVGRERRDREAQPGCDASEVRARPGGCARRRSGRRKVPYFPGVCPFTRHAGLADSRGRIGVVRQGDIVSSIDRSSEWIFRDPESR